MRELPTQAHAEEVYPLLARANLLRMRGRWSEAADLCAEVIRLDAGNASAHSLLGDIYENQGRLEDAIHWYRLALDLIPTSEADAAKLARAQELLEARQRRAEWQAVIEGRHQPILTAVAVRESVQNIVMVVGAAVFGIILVMAILTSASTRLPRNDANASTASRRLATWGRSSQSRTSSERESNLLRKLAESAASRRATVAELLVDPQDQSVCVRVVLPASLVRRVTSAQAKEIILLEAYTAAYDLFIVDPSLSALRMHVNGPLPAPEPDPTTSDRLFVGTLPARNLRVHPSQARLEQDLEGFYQDVWWHPSLSP
ncbi:MAG: tetratricopeptide repeat protein [Armatimonadetes bacterium]|nr:tetratricopeptide repeat protein [Armatimonadota bacterium]